MSSTSPALGTAFHAQLATYLQVQVLRGPQWSPLWGTPSSVWPTLVWCEAPTAVDDIEVQFSDGHRAWVQAKRSVDMSRQESSEIAKVFRQFVRSVAKKECGAGDVLVLAVGTGTTPRVINDLKVITERVRNRQSLEESYTASTENEREVRVRMLDHLTREWEKELGGKPSLDELVAIISRVRVECVDFGANGGHYLSAVEALGAILVDPSSKGAAWDAILLEFVTVAIGTRQGGGAAWGAALLGRSALTRLRSTVPGTPKLGVGVVSPSPRGPVKHDQFTLSLRNDGDVPLQFARAASTDRADRDELEGGTFPGGKALPPGTSASVHVRVAYAHRTGRPPLYGAPSFVVYLQTGWAAQEPEFWELLVGLATDNRSPDGTGAWQVSSTSIWPSTLEAALGV